MRYGTARAISRETPHPHDVMHAVQRQPVASFDRHHKAAYKAPVAASVPCAKGNHYTCYKLDCACACHGRMG